MDTSLLAFPKPVKKTKEKTRKKSTPRELLEKKLDKITTQVVIARDKKCVTCGSNKKLGNGHLFTRVYKSVRWDLRNCNAQCWGCNYKHEFDPYPYNNWFIEKYGKPEWDALYERARRQRKYTLDELESIYKYLENELAKYL